MSIISVKNDTATKVSIINAQKPVPPTINGYGVAGTDDLALLPAGSQTVQINGTGFLPGATVTFDGSAVSVVTFVNPTQLTFTSPAKSAGTYTIYVVNPDGGTAIYIPGIVYSTAPTWSTSAGTLGSYYETTSISNTVIATGDAPLTYSLYSGSLPTGATLAANGVITGTSPADSSSTTYSFTIEAIDAQLQSSTRSFSLTINTDVVTWSSPASGATITNNANTAISNVTLSAASAAGYSVSYSANTLPTGLSLSGSTISGTPTVVADTTTLLTATAATTNRTATRVITWNITVANDTYFKYVTTLLSPTLGTLPFNDDASTNNFAVTIAGDTKPNSFNPHTPGYYSNYFDGTGDYLQKVSPSTNYTDWGSSSFTVEYWINAAAFASGANGGSNVLGNANDAGDGEYWTFGPISTGAVRFYYYNGSPNSFTTSATLSTNKWYHLAFVNNNNTLTIYIDGVSSATASKSGTPQYGSALAFSIGKCTGSSFNGYISNLRITQSAVYTSNFTPPTSPLTAISGTQLLTCQSNRVIDNSTNNVAFTVYGDTSVKSFEPFTPNSSYASYGSGYFDGTGDYLTFPNNTAFAFGTGAFTIEFWINAPLNNDKFILGGRSAIGTMHITTGGYLSTAGVLRYNGSSTIVSTNVITDNSWHHCAIVRDGSNNITLYVDGVSVGTGTDTTNYTTTTGTWIMGGNDTSYPTNVGSNNLTGYISNFRIVKGTAVYTTTFTPSTTPLSAISGTSLLTYQTNQPLNNSTFLDNSTNNFLITRNGNTTQGTFSPYGANWSNYFDGSGDYLSLADDNAFDFSTGDFTIEAWVYPQNTSGTGIVEHRAPTPGTAPYLWYLTGTNMYPEFYTGTSYTGNISVPINTWSHIAVSRQSGTLRQFVNGVLAYSGTVTTALDSTGIVRIMSSMDASQYLGYASNIRVVKGTAVYTSAFTPPTTPLTAISGTSLLTCQSNRLIDNSTNNFTITKNGDVSVQRFSPFNATQSYTPSVFGGSGYFDGSGDYLSYGSNSSLSFGTRDFTVEAWIYITSYGTGFSIFSVGGASTGSYALYTTNSTNKIQSTRYGDSAGAGTTTNTIPLNTWVHVAAVRNNGTAYVYLNGVSDAGASYSLGAVTNTGASTGLVFGSGVTGTGYVSDLRVINGTALYTGNFVPPSTPLTAVQNTTLLTNMTGAAIYDSSEINNFETVGDVKVNTTTVKYGNSSLYFDGTGDYLSGTPVGSGDFGTGDFTIEYWMNASAAGTYSGPVGTQEVSGNSTAGMWRCLNRYNSSNGIYFAYTTGSSFVDITFTTTNYNDGNWHHVAFVKSGTSLKAYVDGTQVGTAATVTQSLSSGKKLTLGYNPQDSAYYTGYISDLRITKGYARYTTNFTAPATAHLVY